MLVESSSIERKGIEFYDGINYEFNKSSSFIEVGSSGQSSMYYTTYTIPKRRIRVVLFFFCDYLESSFTVRARTFAETS